MPAAYKGHSAKLPSWRCEHLQAAPMILGQALAAEVLRVRCKFLATLVWERRP